MQNPSDALGNFTSVLPQLEAALFAGNKERAAATETQKQATLDQGAALATSSNMAAENTIAVDDVHRQLLAAVGLDINDPSSALNKERNVAAQTRANRESINNKIGELEGVSFFQNPFAFMAAQPQLQKLTAQYNVLANSENSANAEIARLQSVAESVLRLTPANNADIIRKKAQADGIAISKAAEAKAAELSAQNSAGNAKTLLDAFNARHNVFASVLQMQQLEDANFWRNEKMKDNREKDALKVEEKTRETALVTGINLYRKAINGSAAIELTTEDVKRMPAELKSAWYETILRGNYGNSYLESVPFINRFGNKAAAASAGNAGMMGLTNNIEKRVHDLAPQIINRERTKNGGVTIPTNQALAMAYNELYAADVGAGARGGDKSGVSAASPYAIDFEGAAALAANTKAPGIVSKSLVGAKERTPYANLNNTFTSAMLLNEVEARVSAGEASPKQAAEELARFVALTAATNYEQNGLRYLALPPPTDWVIRAGGTGKQTVDLMDPTKLENYFTSKVAAAKRARSSIGGNANSFGIYR